MTIEATRLLYVALIAWGCAVMLMTQTLTARTPESPYVRYNRKKLVFYTGFVTACLPMALVFSLRYQTGTDTPVYVERFQDFATIGSFGDLMAGFREMEPGYVLLNVLVNAAGGSVYVVFAVVALIMFVCIGKGLWNFSSQLPAAFVFYILLLLLFPYSFNIMRQMIAVFFVWCALGPMLDRQWFRFLLLIGLACLFHATAAILLPFFFAAGTGRRSKWIALCLAGGFVAFYLGFVLNWLPDMTRISHYFVKNGTLKPSVFVLRIPFFLPFMFYRRITQLNPRYRVFFLFLLIELIFASLSNYNADLNRIALYFKTSWAILIPATVRAMPTTKWAITATALALLCVTVLFYREFIHFNYGQWIPYQWCLGAKWGIVL